MTAPRSASMACILLVPRGLVRSIEMGGDALPTLVIRIYKSSFPYSSVQIRLESANCIIGRTRDYSLHLLDLNQAAWLAPTSLDFDPPQRFPAVFHSRDSAPPLRPYKSSTRCTLPSCKPPASRTCSTGCTLPSLPPRSVKDKIHCDKE
jgi:hypothetical protein